MKLWSKNSEAPQSHPRVKRMDTVTLANWLDVAVMGLGAAVDDWRYRAGSKEMVNEQLEAIQMMWNELSSRS